MKIVIFLSCLFFSFNTLAFETIVPKENRIPDFEAKLLLDETENIWGDFYRIELVYREYLKNYPDDLKVHLKLADVLTTTERYEESEEMYNDILLKFPNEKKIIDKINELKFLQKEEGFQKKLIIKEPTISPLIKDPKSIAARLETAESLGVKHKYEESIKILEELADKFPGNRKIYITYARVLSWSKKYNKSIEIYKKIHEANKADPIPIREMARVAIWGKDIDNALKYYEMLYEIPIYKIQRSAYLEREEKYLSYNKRFVPASEKLEELIKLQPWNLEAIFDLAQIQCSLGLCNLEKNIYKKILEIEPLHSIAVIAAEKQQIRSNPLVDLRYNYWNEYGRGELSKIAIHNLNLSGVIPINCKYKLSLSAHNSKYKPKDKPNNYSRTGHTINFNGVISPALQGSISWTKKYYQDYDMGNTDTGYASLWVNLRNYAKIGIGYEKTDELYNDFSVRQKIQADSFWLNLTSDINRRLSIDGKAKYLSYSDNNSGQHDSIAIGYAFTDHPKILKFILTGEFRDVKNENIFHYNGNSLIDITHPYWTPKNYWGTGLTIEWYHDLSKFLFCGSDLHFYDIALSLGNDSTSNPSVRIDAKWHYEFKKHWLINIEGMIHRSNEWDAESFILGLHYQF
ncbi:MAG: hypothetical protein HQK79_20935 [Desulfobacterales bacterium]|nr:hypothetical protein [Desulfobacterales bacterium]